MGHHSHQLILVLHILLDCVALRNDSLNSVWFDIECKWELKTSTNFLIHECVEIKDISLKVEDECVWTLAYYCSFYDIGFTIAEVTLVVIDGFTLDEFAKWFC